MRSLLGALCLTGTASLATGCLVDEPPTFEQPERTAPAMFLQEAVPTYGQTMVLQRNQLPVPFTIKVQSEDLGKRLLATVWVNFGLEGEARIDVERFGPGTFDQPRDIQFYLETSLLPQGCVPITIVLHHEDNVDIETLKPLDFDLATIATWYAIVDATPSDVSFADCPQPSITMPK